MITTIIQALYFFLPAYMANMAPVIASKMNLPGRTPISVQLFGKNKTWRGFIVAFIAALATVAFQKWFAMSHDEFASKVALVDYEHIYVLVWASAFGIGALLGDMIKSFFKRRIGRESGEPWFPFDQLDFVLGALIFLSPVFIPPSNILLALILITPALHFLVNVAAYMLGFKEVWW